MLLRRPPVLRMREPERLGGFLVLESKADSTMVAEGVADDVHWARRQEDAVRAAWVLRHR